MYGNPGRDDGYGGQSRAEDKRVGSGWGEDTGDQSSHYRQESRETSRPHDAKESRPRARGDTGETQSGGWGLDEDNRGERKDADEAKMEVRVVEGLLESLNNVDVKLSDKQADINSPLYSVKSFEQLGLEENLLKGIYAMKFVKPSKVQERALPLLLRNPPQNLIAQSQSGTGKTAAFVLTMLSRVDQEDPSPQALCVVPTRELARQIVDVIKSMGQFTGCTTAMAIRTEAAARRDKINAQIVVGTPGTILDLESRGSLDLSHIRIFVLDEADIMLDKQGMGVQSMRVRKLCPEDAQLLLFSATFTEGVMEFAHRIIPDANEITLRRDELSLDSVKQYYMECQNYHHKMEMLSTIYGLLTIGQSIIFVATRAAAEEIQLHMEEDGHRTSLLHGGMEPQERDKVIDEFRRGVTKVLISTNVLARGIDILQVSLVINFDMPETTERLPDPETYLHRIGRTGRFGRTGVAINFISSRRAMETMLALKRFFEKEILEIPANDLEALERKLNAVTRTATA